MRPTTREWTVGRNGLQTGDAMCAPQLSSVLFRSTEINQSDSDEFKNIGGGYWVAWILSMFSGSWDWEDQTGNEDSLQEGSSCGWD